MSGTRRLVHVARLLALAIVASSLSLGMGELALRWFFPPYRFLNPNRECFWTVRLREQSRTGESDAAVYGSGQYDPLIGWKPQAMRRDGIECTNSRGLRGSREYAAAKADGVLRLVVHGDSFTWGFGVKDPETYAARLEAEHPQVEAINLGVNGHGIDQQYLYWLREGSRYEPDLVILGFFVPDFHRVTLTVREFPKPRFVLDAHGLVAANLPVPPAGAFLADCSGECASGSRLLDLAGAVRRRTIGAETEEGFREKAALTKAILAAWGESVAAAGAELCLVVIPHAQYRAYPDHERIESLLRDSASENGFFFLNLTEPLQEFERSGVDVYRDDHGHWSAAGHAFAARRIGSLLASAPIVRAP